MTQTINYTLDELKGMVKNIAPVPLFNGKYAFEILTADCLAGEIFRRIQYRYNPDIIFEVSNFGRIKRDGKVLPQHEKR